jgi:hypothetical protein
MTAQVANLIEEARELAAALKDAPKGSTEWFARNNVLSFIGTVEQCKDVAGIERAVHALRHWVTDQYDSCQAVRRVSLLAENAAHVARSVRQNNG